MTPKMDRSRRFRRLSQALALCLGVPAVLPALLPALLPSAALGADPYVVISEEDCSRLVRHVPSADVAYRPGMDVRGRPVAPADLGAEDPAGPRALVLPQAVLIPIEVELFERFGIPPGGASFKADALIGEVTVDLESGQALFNGQPLQSEAEAELAVRCQRIMRSSERAQ